MNDRFDREKLIRDKLREQDEAERIVTSDARSLIYGFLTEQKGYRAEDIQKDKVFRISSGDLAEDVSVDYIVTLGGKPYMAIKCSMSLESRHRHALAFSRAAGDVIIPYSLVTDGLKAHLLDTATGGVISEDMDSLPERTKALSEAERMEPSTLPEDRKEKEKRILLAFECASCPREEK